MCGICGVVAARGAPDRRALERMSATLVHRGPDDSGLVLDGPAGLAARRLSIIDLVGGHQPIAGEDGRVVVVQNGEIYNHRELRAELEARGHRFATRCDTEVIVHLYEEVGPAFAERLRGMFAAAVWDGHRERLVLARDRFGIKPLYYRATDGDLAFASELKALVHAPGFSRELDLAALEAYLAFNSIPAPLSIFRDARKLPAGHVLTFEGGRARLERYARPAPVPAAAVRREPFGVLAEELRERLRDSVRAHLLADVPVGVLLSGGIDSSMLAALAAMESGDRVRTFSIGFDERSFDELDRARAVARRYDTDHHELVVRADAVELLPDIVRAFDEPFADSSALPTWLVSRLAAGHVKVALSGEGGDELFGGYETYVADELAPLVAPVAPLLAPLAARLPSSSRRVSLDYKLKRFAAGARLAPLERHHAWKEIFSPDARAELLGGGADGRAAAGGRGDPVDVLRHRWAETAGAERLARLQDVDLGVYLADDLLVKSDRMSMAHSLEMRVPFLDQVVADLALALPTRHKVRGMAKKRLLRAAAAPLVGDEIARGPKRGFSIPAAAWLRGDALPFAREVLSPAVLRRQGYLDAGPVGRLLDEHVGRRQDHSRQLWGLMCFTLWHDAMASAAAGDATAVGVAEGLLARRGR